MPSEIVAVSGDNKLTIVFTVYTIFCLNIKIITTYKTITMNLSKGTIQKIQELLIRLIFLYLNDRGPIRSIFESLLDSAT